MGRSLSDTVIPIRYRADHDNGMRRFLRSGEGPILNRRVEMTALRRDGSEFPIELSVAPYRVGDSWAFSGFVRDITERKRLYSELQQREARVRRLFDADVIGIFIWRLDGRITDANDAFLNIVKYDRGDLMAGRLNWKGLTPEDWQSADNERVRQLKTSGTSQPYEKQYIQKNGGRVPVMVGAATFEGSEDEGVAFVLDLTERHRAEAMARELERRYREVQRELAHANRVATMGQLSASIAHEVNQPIAAAVTNAYAALRWLGGDSPDLMEARLALERIVTNGSHANDVINRIRAFVKRAPPQKVSIDINSGIAEVIASTRGEAVKNGVYVRTNLAHDLPAIEGDRVQIQQVVLNLILNSIEAMSEFVEGPRELVIRTTRTEPDGVLVVVRDTGPGLPAEALEHIFEAFYTTKLTGLGMGLSICRSIVEAHGGRLWAAQNSPHGATLAMMLPTHSES